MPHEMPPAAAHPRDSLAGLIRRLLRTDSTAATPVALPTIPDDLDATTAADLLALLQSCCDADGLLSAPADGREGPRLCWPHQGQYYVPDAAGGAFIHPEPETYLAGRLDAFARNLLVSANLDGSGGPDLDAQLSRISRLRATAAPIFAAIARTEATRKQHWLAQAQVRETHYCLTLDRVPRAFYAEIAANEAQRAAWFWLHGIEPTAPDHPRPLPVAFLEAHPFLMLDTCHFDESFVQRLLAAFDNLDAALDGLLIHGDNFHALTLLEPQYVAAIDCIYTDPPYNTGGNGLSYPDRYAPAHWLTLIDNRLRLAHQLLKPGGSCFISIDENQQARLELLLADIFAPEDFVATFVWEAGRKNDSKLVSISHEYMLAYVKGLTSPARKGLTWRVRKEGLDEIHARARLLVRRCGGDYARASLKLRQWFRGLPDNHPARRHRHYHCIDARGVYHPSNISWPGGGGPRYEVLHPITGRPCKIPSRGWMYPTAERMAEAVRDDRVHFGPDETRVPCAKVYLHTNEHQAPNSVFYRDGRAAMKRLRHMLGADCFCNPKDELLIADRIRFASPPDATVLDLFAGSGSTGHAVIHLNRTEDSRRRYILMEMSDTFDTILRPRIQKAVFASKWKQGQPLSRDGLSHMFKYVRLGSK